MALVEGQFVNDSLEELFVAQDKIRDLVGKIDNLKLEKDLEAQSLRSKIDMHLAKIAKMSEEYTELQRQKRDLERLITKQISTPDATTLEELEAAKVTVADLQGTVQGAEITNAELRENLQGAKSKIDDLEVRVTDATSREKHLAEQNKVLWEHVRNTETFMRQARETNAPLLARIGWPRDARGSPAGEEGPSSNVRSPPNPPAHRDFGRYQSGDLRFGESGFGSQSLKRIPTSPGSDQRLPKKSQAFTQYGEPPTKNAPTGSSASTAPGNNGEVEALETPLWLVAEAKKRQAATAPKSSQPDIRVSSLIPPPTGSTAEGAQADASASAASGEPESDSDDNEFLKAMLASKVAKKRAAEMERAAKRDARQPVSSSSHEYPLD
ncbi:MAG: hypothetical protein L6R39_001762 [Caloplaca ligustica]|nr:MAG: hypothetical protein L6R39_001762 [Caloplaca ligustica]